MFALTERKRAQLEQFHFIQSALLTYKMLTHKGERLQQREQILPKKNSHVFLFMHILLIVSQKKGSGILLHCVPQLACKSVIFFIGQLLINVVDACFSYLRAEQICIGLATKNLKTYRITTVLIKMNVLSNLSDSEFSIGHDFVNLELN